MKGNNIICITKLIELAYGWRQIIFCVIVLFILYLRVIFTYKPLGAYIQWGVLTDGFWCYEFEGLIHGGAYFRNFTVYFVAFS